MKRLLAVLVLLAAACTGTTVVVEPEPPPIIEVEEPAIQLVTETELRRGVDQATWAHTLCWPLVQALNDWPISNAPGYDFPQFSIHITRCGIDDNWADNHTIFIAGDIEENHPLYPWSSAGGFRARVVLGDYTYVPGKSTVKQSNCVTTDSGGVDSTGQFFTVDATQFDDPVKVAREVKTTVGTSSSTTLKTDFETSAGFEVKGGVPFGEEATAKIESKFALGKEQVTGSEQSTEVTISIDTEVLGGHDVAFVITDDHSAILCDVQIVGIGDWGRITIICDAGCTGHNWGIVHKSLRFGGSNSATFDSFDDFLRFMLGHDTRCPECAHLRINSHGRANLNEALNNPDLRAVRLDGQRTVAQSSGASYKIIDVTGSDKDCVNREFAQKDRRVSDLEQAC